MRANTLGKYSSYIACLHLSNAVPVRLVFSYDTLSNCSNLVITRAGSDQVRVVLKSFHRFLQNVLKEERNEVDSIAEKKWFGHLTGMQNNIDRLTYVICTNRK